MVRRYALVSLVLTAALAASVAFACNGGGANDSPDPAAAEPTPRVTVGNGGADLILNAALGRDIIELARLTGYTGVPCAPEGEAVHEALVCRPEEEPGENVNVLRVTRCESGWVRPEVVTDVYEAMLSDEPELAAMYRPTRSEGDGDGLPVIEHVAVFRTDDRPDGTQFGVAFHVADGRIVHAEEPCTGILQLLTADRVDEWELAPGESPRIIP